jgi:hypothetical protein
MSMTGGVLEEAAMTYIMALPQNLFGEKEETEENTVGRAGLRPGFDLSAASQMRYR